MVAQRVGGRIDWEFGISRCKLLLIRWINYKVLLHSTGNYIQYPVITISSVQSLSCVQFFVTNYSMLGFPVHHQLPELTQTHVLLVSDAI